MSVSIESPIKTGFIFKNVLLEISIGFEKRLDGLLPSIE